MPQISGSAWRAEPPNQGVLRAEAPPKESGRFWRAARRHRSDLDVRFVAPNNNEHKARENEMTRGRATVSEITVSR